MKPQWIKKIMDSPGAMALVVAALALAGMAAYFSLKVDLFPELNFPILNIVSEQAGFSSLEMERQVSLPLESTVGSVPGVTRIRSTSGTGISMVSVEFAWGTDMNYARGQLLQALAGARDQLPAGVDPVVENLSASLAMVEGWAIQGNTGGNVDPAELRELANLDLRPRLQRLPGVYKVVILGGSIREVSVLLNPDLMAHYDVTLEDLRTALQNENFPSSPGLLNQGQHELVLHANSQLMDASQVADCVVALRDGKALRVRDLGKVSMGRRAQRGEASQDGGPAVLLNIYKQPGSDTQAMAKAVEAEIADFKNGAGKGLRISNYYDQAELVGDSVGSVKEAVALGGILVVLVLAFFLRDIKATLVAALSIPVSVLAAIVGMRAFGIGINVMSLGGLAIGTAVIVDDAIVVLENIFRRSAGLAAKGLAERVAQATSEVAVPVAISTLANIAIFLPMVLLGGLAGRLFAPVGWTITFCLIASLVVALSLIPALSLRLIKASGHQESEGRLRRIYGRLLDWAIRRPVLALVLGLIPSLIALLQASHLETSFLPALDEGAVLVDTLLPPGVSLEESGRVNRDLELWFKGMPGVATAARITGHAPGAEDTDNENHSDIMLRLKPKSERPMALEKWLAKLDDETGKREDIKVTYLMPLADKINDALGEVPADLAVDIYGPDLDKLGELAEAAFQSLSKVAGLSELRMPENVPVPSLEVKLRRGEASDLGISMQAVDQALAAGAQGLEATRLRDAQKETAVVLHLPGPPKAELAEAKSEKAGDKEAKDKTGDEKAAAKEGDKEPAKEADKEADKGDEREGPKLDPKEVEKEIGPALGALSRLPLRAVTGLSVPLGQLAVISMGVIPSAIEHENLSRRLVLTSNFKGRDSREIVADVRASLSKLNLPRGYFWKLSGRQEAQSQAAANMAMVLGLAIGIVCLVLWLEFHKPLQVGLILATIPLAAVGAVLGLKAFGQTLNVSSLTGAVLLVGVVVRNGIMLLDAMNRALAQGLSPAEAARAAAMIRLRPILMTASVTMLGLLPLALGWGTGSELQRPLAIAVVGGMLSSTLLTLVLLPAASALWMNRSAKARSRS
jgi:cobalt-zinc-cadmium resistance protein CzcA